MASSNQNLSWAYVVIPGECQNNHHANPAAAVCPQFEWHSEALNHRPIRCATCHCPLLDHPPEEVAIQLQPQADQMIRYAAATGELLPINIQFAPMPALAGDVENPVGDGEIEVEQSTTPPQAAATSGKTTKTRFSPEQKEAMIRYGKRLNWSLVGHDKVGLARFCSEIGVTPQVFKTWIRNNKGKYMVA